MDFDEYRIRGKEMVDYIADYLENIRSRRVFPNVKPGYMRKLVPNAAPEDGECWNEIFRDVERVIMPGMTHWQSPYMHAYFPALNSCPSLLGDMLADAINCLGFTWASSPACTELETIVMDWLGKMIALPSEFLHSSNSHEQTMGGGVIQTTASESTFVSLLAARTQIIRKCKANDPSLEDADINGLLVGYCSEQAHSSVEKAGLIGLVKMQLLPCDDKLSLRGETLREAIKQDRERGLIPFYLCATLGTTGACAFDNLKELGPVCEEEDIWMHIDAAYAGTAFICPEFRYLMAGVEYAESFAFNPSKWMMVHFDCTAMWLKNSGALHRTFNIQPLYLQHENTGAAIDYMHWQIPLSKRFRALKLWFVIRSFGIAGLQRHIRKGVSLAKFFENMVKSDARFEVAAERYLGMVVFRLKGDNIHTETLLKRINKSGKLHCVPASFKGKYVIRFTVTSQYTTEEDITRDWAVIMELATEILVEDIEEIPDDEVFVEGEEEENGVGEDEREINVSKPVSIIGRMRREGMKRHDFGMSLILSNVPMSPKFINGSFAALFDDNNDVMMQYVKTLQRRSMDYNNQPIRLSPRKKLRDQGKQYSLDVVRPNPNRRDLPHKQGSLDSKIEEIFENSFESESQDETSNDEERSNSSIEKVNNNISNMYLNVPQSDKKITLIEEPKLPANFANAKNVTNGMYPIICRHCGHAFESEG